jgi:hypothetical protein
MRLLDAIVLITVVGCGKAADLGVGDAPDASVSTRAEASDAQTERPSAASMPSNGDCRIPDEETVEYERIVGMEPDAREVGLCELVQSYRGGAGLYTVTRLIGASGYTYVDLDLRVAWSSDTPQSPRLKVVGGPVGELTRLWDIGLARGDEVGVILEPASYPRSADPP